MSMKLPTLCRLAGSTCSFWNKGDRPNQSIPTSSLHRVCFRRECCSVTFAVRCILLHSDANAPRVLPHEIVSTYDGEHSIMSSKQKYGLHFHSWESVILG